MAGIQLSQLPVCRALPGKNTVVFACLVRLPGLKVYHLEKTNKQQILRCFHGEATWCGTRMHRTQNRALVYILPRPGSASSPSLLWASVSHFIRGRSSQPRGCWELLMRGCERALETRMMRVVVVVITRLADIYWVPPWQGHHTVCFTDTISFNTHKHPRKNWWWW